MQDVINYFHNNTYKNSLKTFGVAFKSGKTERLNLELSSDISVLSVSDEVPYG